MPFIGKRFARQAITAVATLALGAGLFVGLGPTLSGASSHREAPLVSADPQIDGTDLYAFVSPNNKSTVTLISNWIPFEEPAGGPNFYSFAQGVHYDINIDNNADAVPDVIYRWIFTNHYRNTNTFLYNTGVVTSLSDPDLNFYQTYDLLRIVPGGGTKKLLDDAPVAPSDVGAGSMPDYQDDLFDPAVVSTSNGKFTSWAGQADDPFFLDLRVFDLLYGGNFSETGHDTLAGFNVNAFAIQVPKSDIALNGNPSRNPVVGIWTTAERRSVRTEGIGTQSFSGKFVQVSRLGMPLVNEVVIPLGLKDAFNSLPPSADHTIPAVVAKVQDPELPHVVNALYGLPVPDCAPGGAITRDCDLFPVFLTGLPGLTDPLLNADVSTVVPAEMLRLNMSIAPCHDDCSTLGVIGGDNSGFPNGRRLSDDIIDVSLRVTEGILIPGHNPAVDSLSDGVGGNDKGFQHDFPFLAYPTHGSSDEPHGETPSHVV